MSVVQAVKRVFSLFRREPLMFVHDFSFHWAGQFINYADSAIQSNDGDDPYGGNSKECARKKNEAHAQMCDKCKVGGFYNEVKDSMITVTWGRSVSGDIYKKSGNSRHLYSIAETNNRDYHSFKYQPRYEVKYRITPETDWMLVDEDIIDPSVTIDLFTIEPESDAVLEVQVRIKIYPNIFGPTTTIQLPITEGIHRPLQEMYRKKERREWKPWRPKKIIQENGLQIPIPD